MSAKKIYGFVGLIACGKGTAAKYLQSRYQATTFRFSTVLRDILDRVYLEQSRDNMQKLSTVLRENFSQDILSRAIAEDIKKAGTKLIAIDGIRRLSDVEYLKDLPSFKLVAIEVDAEIRYQRLISRNENVGDAEKTWEEFLADDQAEAENQIKESMLKADIHLNNNNSLENFYQQLDKLVN